MAGRLLGRFVPAVSGLLAAGTVLAGLLFFLSPQPRVEAADEAPRLLAGVRDKDHVVLAVVVPPHKAAADLTVELVGSDGKVLATSERKCPASDTLATESFRLAAPKAAADQVKVRFRSVGEPVEQPLKQILLARGHETTLATSTELFSGSQAALRCQVRGVKSMTETVPLTGATVSVRLSGPDGRERTVLNAPVGRDGVLDGHFEVPEGPAGNWKMVVVTKSALGEEKLERAVTIKTAPRVLLTSDKPLYQPGQTMHLRALALRAFDLKPASKAALVLEIEDARGNKVFKKELTTSEYGIAATDFTLADEVNQGDYRIRALLGDVTANKTVTVKPYVLPKFKPDLKADKRFYLPKETIQGELQVDYFFGKPVAKGKIKVTARTQGVALEEFATWEGATDEHGHAKFDIKLPNYFVGLPLAKGNALVRLEVKVTDTADHSETVTRTYPVSEQPIQLSLIPEAGQLHPGLENRIFVAALHPDGTPAHKAKVRVWIGKERKGQPFAEVSTNETGLAEVTLTPKGEQFREGPWAARPIEMLGGVAPQVWLPSRLFDLSAEVQDTTGNKATVVVELSSEPRGENVLLRLDKAIYQGGDRVGIDIRSSAGLPTVYLDVIKNGQLLLSRWLDVKGGRATDKIDLPAGAFGTLEIHAYQMLGSGEIIRDSRVVYASPASDLKIAVQADQTVYQPGAEGKIRFQVTDQDGKPSPAALGVLIVDEAVYALQDLQPGLEKVYFTLQEELLKPRAELLYKPGENLETLIRQPAIPAQKQQAAKVLLTSVRPNPPTGWKIDPASARRQQMEQRIAEIGHGLFQFVHDRGPGLNKGKKAGTWQFAPDLLEAAAKAGYFNRASLQTPLGDQLTLEDLTRLEPGFNPDSFGVALTHYRLSLLGAYLHQTAHAKRDRYFKDKKLIVRDGLLLEVLDQLHVDRRFGRDAWGGEIRLVKRTDNNHSGIDVLEEYTLVSAGPDGKFDTKDDITYQRNDNWGWSWHESWWLEGRTGTVNPRDRRNLRGMNGHWMQGRGVPAGLPGMMPGGPGGMRPGQGAGTGGGGGPEMLRRDTKERATADPSARTGEGGAGGGAAPEPSRMREYFPETLLWQPALITDDKGRATLPVTFADSITTWRLTASASSRGGLLGGASVPLRVFQDFFVDLDLPAALTQNDEVAFPVAVYNYLKVDQKVTLALEPEAWFELTDGLGLKRTLDLKANEVSSLRFRIKAKKVGRFPLTVTARGTKLADASKRTIEVLPDGEKVEQVVTDQLSGSVRHTITMPEDAIPGASRLLVKLHPGIMSQVLEGADGLLRMPGGCMEQTSSSAYPNVLIVDYIKKTKTASPAVLMKAEHFLNVGYQRLLTFERPGGGFDWWGSGPPLVWLSAYGLHEFNDMARVYPIDQGVLERTKGWLMKQQAADGTWSNIGATHGVSIERMGDPKLLLTSYVAWSILDSTRQTPEWRKSEEYKKLAKAIDYIRTNAPKADSPYILGLAANALAAWDAKDDSTFDLCKKVLAKLDGMKQARPEWKAACFPTQGHSLSYARGDSLTVETTALAVLAMLKHGGFTTSVNQCLAYLIRSKDPHGTWGSTQATILALKALVASSGGGGTRKETVPFTVSVNGKEVASGEVNEKNADVMQQFDLREHLKSGPNEVVLAAKGETGLVYQVVGRHWQPARKVVEPARPLLEIDVAYDRTKLSTADLLKARATVRYNGKDPTSMMMVELGIPPGFVVDPGEFAELVAQKKVNKFSVTARQVILYLGDFEPGVAQSFDYVLRPKYPIKAKAPAAVAYEYYTPTNRAAAKPIELVVEEVRK